MHVNKSRLGGILLPIEETHITNCEECAYEHQILNCLIKDAEEIELTTPPMSDWLAIKARIEKKKKRNQTSIGQVLFGVAASTFFLAAGWLLWSNYHLQSQLEQVILANQYLELELEQEQSPTFRQATLLTEISGVEYKLYHSKSEKEKLMLLKAREKLMKKIVEQQKEAHHEFSI